METQTNRYRIGQALTICLIWTVASITESKVKNCCIERFSTVYSPLLEGNYEKIAVYKCSTIIELF